MNPALRHSAAHLFVESLSDPQISDADQHHVQRVLRVRDGQRVTLSDGAGSWAEATWRAGAAELDGPAVYVDRPPASCVVSAIPKGERVDLVVQKLTELGIAEIVLADMDRSVVRWDGARLERQRQRLWRIAVDAAAQSRRVWLPTLVIGEPLAVAAARHGAAFAEPDGQDPAGRCLIIGPEGGFSERELAIDLPRVALSTQILRVETAAIVAGIRISTHTE